MTRQYRHRDLDLAVDAADLDRCLAALGSLGYAAETDWLPSRIELHAPGDRWVDIHPVAFGADGTGRQADLEGGFFAYPPDAFGRGLIAGRTIPCLSARQQRRFRTGYQHRTQDVLAQHHPHQLHRDRDRHHRAVMVTSQGRREQPGQPVTVDGRLQPEMREDRDLPPQPTATCSPRTAMFSDGLLGAELVAHFHQREAEQVQPWPVFR